jgi:hypothetical protein
MIFRYTVYQVHYPCVVICPHISQSCVFTPINSTKDLMRQTKPIHRSHKLKNKDFLRRKTFLCILFIGDNL